jgi:hypothetical protein
VYSRDKHSYPVEWESFVFTTFTTKTHHNNNWPWASYLVPNIQFTLLSEQQVIGDDVTEAVDTASCITVAPS